ncbi:hypothetical protein [Paenibacillus sp. PK1-4R]|uniref:hypothetical protein n=1 Tax=Paenibacillus sp. PK1-4R TaxID=3049075 RepID=UPI0025A2530C|nr:hypothetical protein [Paenibacillus sp. PK1-4R]WJM05867.1 hypothetical protein QNO02_16420 [Paenibacillus sp. PK1-4R]
MGGFISDIFEEKIEAHVSCNANGDVQHTSEYFDAPPGYIIIGIEYEKSHHGVGTHAYQYTNLDDSRVIRYEQFMHALDVFMGGFSEDVQKSYAWVFNIMRDALRKLNWVNKYRIDCSCMTGGFGSGSNITAKATIRFMYVGQAETIMSDLWTWLHRYPQSRKYSFLGRQNSLIYHCLFHVLVAPSGAENNPILLFAHEPKAGRTASTTNYPYLALNLPRFPEKTEIYFKTRLCTESISSGARPGKIALRDMANPATPLAEQDFTYSDTSLTEYKLSIPSLKVKGGAQIRVEVIWFDNELENIIIDLSNTTVDCRLQL